MYLALTFAFQVHPRWIKNPPYIIHKVNHHLWSIYFMKNKVLNVFLIECIYEKHYLSASSSEWFI